MDNQNNYMALDLEFNQPSNIIFQIGVTVGNIKTEEILEKKSWIINCNEELNPFIKDLCHITQEEVNAGITLEQAYKELIGLHNKYNCFRNAITWGGGDSEQLRKQLNLDNEIFLFGRRWIDTKTLYSEWRTSQNKPRQGGLKKALINLGMKFEGTAHTADDDSYNTMRAYFALQRKWRS